MPNSNPVVIEFLSAEILVCETGGVKHRIMNFFRWLQKASDGLHGRLRGSGAISVSLAGFAYLS
jgi:hypothetical protein